MSPARRTLTSFDAGGQPPAQLLAPATSVPPGVPAGLARRFREAFATPYDDWLAGPPYAQLDGAPNWPAGLGRGASGTTADRKAGKDLPQFWSELDLRGYRTMARWLWDTNPFMAGFGARLVDYHVGRGFRWQACRRGQAKQPYATASSADPLLKRAQTVLDEWRDRAAWPLVAREGFRRLRRDGEVVHRLTPGPDGLAEHRFVNPEQVGSPTGDADGRGSFGVERGDDPDDRDAGGRPVRVYVRDHDGDGTDGRWENCDPLDPAARVLFFKTNTDSDVKRGLPDSFSVHEALDECRKLVRNMVVVACAQAAIAWLEKFPTATAEQVRALIPTGAPRADVPAWANGYGESTYSEKVAAGTVLRTEGSREFVPGPASKAVGGYIEAEQAALRMACVRWGFPPYLTAKADDINFASSLTAGSPFAVAVAGGQAEWAVVERAVALKVLDLAAEAGRLTWDERRQLDVEVTAPTVITPDPGAETQRNKVLFDAKILDPYTWMQREGLDPAHVEANWVAWNRRNATQPGHPGEGGARLPGEPPPPGDDLEGGGSVAEAKEKRKPGEKWKKNGRWYTLRDDGKTIRIPNQDAHSADGPAGGGQGSADAGTTGASGAAAAGGTLPPPPPPPPPQGGNNEDAPDHAATATRWLDGSGGQGLPAELRDRYHGHVTATLSRLPAASARRVVDVIDRGGITFHPDTDSVRRAKEEITGRPDTEALAFTVDYGNGTADVVIDGGSETDGSEFPGDYVYAHEFGHVVDASGAYSSRPAWQEAYDRDIIRGGEILTQYARSNPAEGFAELYAALATEGAESVRRRFPACYRFLQAEGLVTVAEHRDEPPPAEVVTEAPARPADQPPPAPGGLGTKVEHLPDGRRIISTVVKPKATPRPAD